MLLSLLTDTLTIRPPSDAVQHNPYPLPGRIEAVKRYNLYTADVPTPGQDAATHLGYVPSELFNAVGEITGTVHIGLGTQIDSALLASSFYVSAPAREGMGRYRIDHLEVELREMGEFRDWATIFRPAGTADDEGNPIADLGRVGGQVWEGYSQWQAASATPTDVGSVAGDVLNAFLRLPLSADVRPGDIVHVRGFQWRSLGVLDALDHIRVTLRRVG